MGRLLLVLLVILVVVGVSRADAHPQTVWLRVADCETGGDEHGRPPYRAVWNYNGRSGFDGGLQFLPSTWNMAKMKGPVRAFAARYDYAWQAPAWVQIQVAEHWLTLTSWLQWPSCSRSVGLR